jgi:hypothetical protein
MAKQKGFDLFDAIEQEELKENPEAQCSHRREKFSLTQWPGENFTRFTMTCIICGRVRGRYPKEQETV